MPHDCRSTGRASSGSKGATGSKPGNSAAGIYGKAGNSANLKYTKKEHSNKLNFTFKRMVLQEAETAYLNEHRQVSAEKLLWLLEIIEAGNKNAQETADLMMVGEEPDFDDEVQKEAICKRIKVLLTQLSQGLDYYGYPSSFVPLTSVKVYHEAIDSMLLLATDIEKAYNDYYTKQQSDIKMRNALSQAVSTLELKITGLDSQFEQLVIEVNQGRLQISQLLVEEIQLEEEMRAASQKFKDAVSREAACGFVDVLKATAAVAAIATGVGAVVAGVAALGKAGEMIEKSESLKEWKQSGEYIVKHSVVIKGGVDSISSGYSDIKETLERERDGAKLIAVEEDFEEAVKKFEHLEEAREYRNAMRRYLNIIKLRNNKILEVDTKITRILEIESEQELLNIEVDLTKGRTVQVFNPRLAEHYVFFDKALARIKTDLIRAIVMANRALSYWSLRDNLLPQDLTTRTISYIKSYQLTFKSSLLRLIEDRNSALLKITPPKIVFTRDSHPEEFATFDQTGRFTFVITENSREFRYSAQALVNKAKLELQIEGVLDGSSWLFMQHHGDAVIVDTFGGVHRYSHRYRETKASLLPGEFKAELELGGSDQYAFLSPLASWSFMMKFDDNIGGIQVGADELKSRQKISSIKLGFDGVAHSRYTNELARNDE